MRRATLLALVFLGAPAAAPSSLARFAPVPPSPPRIAASPRSAGGSASSTDSAASRDADPDEALRAFAEARLAADVLALELFRPGYPFWAHVFTVPDGSIAFGSGTDGRLLATFPGRGDWRSEGRWWEAGLSGILEGQDLARRTDDRREQVAALLEPRVGPVIHNPTRGDFLLPNAERYGAFLEEWGRIYERFGVPAEIGLAQAVVESGLSGTIKSEARAIGFCQWLPRNWQRLERLTAAVIEAPNQTTQAAYCAAHLTVLATKYGSFIPALSEHHAGSVNVGRALINGDRLGGGTPRERYFLGAEYARDVRALGSPRAFRPVVGTFGPRSFLYVEMVFGNAATVERIRDATPQQEIFAMRARRDLPLAEVARRSGLSTDEVKRYNPALVRRVPRGADVYLPAPVEEFGPDVSFWHRPAPEAFAAVLDDFVRLDEPPEAWQEPAFESVLQEFRRRFRATDTEEGSIMDAVLGYVIQGMPLGRRILADYRSDPDAERLFREGVRLREVRER